MITIQPRKSSLQQTFPSVNDSTAQPPTSPSLGVPSPPPPPPQFPCPPKKTVILKTLLLGDSGVGKTALFNRITKNSFNPYSKPTAGIDFSNHHVKIEQSKTIKAQLVDTSGLERYRSVTQSYWQLANGAILVFDVSNRASFVGLQRWAKDFCSKFQSSSSSIRPQPVVMIIGNKCDLAREVDVQEAQAFALENNFIYMETSALNNTNVSLAFNIFIVDVYHMMEEREKLASCSTKQQPQPNIPINDHHHELHPPEKKKQRPKSLDEVFFQSVSSFFKESIFSPQFPPPLDTPSVEGEDDNDPRSALSSGSSNVPVIILGDFFPNQKFEEKPLHHSLFRSNSISNFGERRKSRYL